MDRRIRTLMRADDRPYEPPPKAKASEILGPVMRAPIDELAKEAVRQTVDRMCREGQLIDDRGEA